MSRPRILFALSADFGEYVTASLFCRGGTFEATFALPPPLARYAPAGQANIVAYDNVDALAPLAARLGADVVVLASGYLFPVNRIATPEALRELVARIEQGGAAVATTDPWLRIWTLRPGSRFAIHSVRKGAVDDGLSGRMQALQGFLDELFRGKPHLLAAPLPAADETWMPFYNPAFVPGAPPAPARDPACDEWLFVISKEDWTFSAGIGAGAFASALGERIGELLARPRNRLRFVGPPELGRYLEARWRGEPRVEYLAFCDFAAFEALLRRATVVAYWNVISSTLLYCLYYRVPPVFFGAGHQAKILPGLYEHAVEHLYRGRGPRLLDLASPLGADADAQHLIARLELPAWLDAIGADYERLPAPSALVERIAGHHVS